MGGILRLKRGIKYYYLKDDDTIDWDTAHKDSIYFEDEKDAKLEQVKRRI